MSEWRARRLRKSTQPNGRTFSQRRLIALGLEGRAAKAKCKTDALGRRCNPTHSVAAAAAPQRRQTHQESYPVSRERDLVRYQHLFGSARTSHK